MRSYLKSTYEYTKLRRNFGRQPLFQIVPAHIIDSINPDPDLQKEYMLRNPVHKGIQATLPQTENESNTKRMLMHEQGINHTEGGWPRDVHIYNEEHLCRHRRRVQHEENYVQSVLNLKPSVEHYINQNNVYDMYESYFSDIQPQPSVEKYNVQIANIFRDPFHRPTSDIVWTNERNAKIIASYCHKKYPIDNEKKKENVCYVWDVNRQTAPMLEFYPSHGCWQLAGSPVDSDILITGLDNGIVSIFDFRVGTQSIASSSIYNSHFEPITALLYTHSRTNTEFFTGSPDGQCLWWDMRNLSKPIDQLSMSIKLAENEEPNLNNSEGVSSLQFDRGLPTKFLCGTVSGLIINVNRMGRSHSEVLTSFWNGHTGPVRAVHRSPCTLRMFITCGDWNVRIWSEEVRSAPIIENQPYCYQVTDVAWAPLRYSCYMVVSEDGIFYYWDLLRKYKQPVAKLHVTNHGLTKITPHPEGESIAVSDRRGSLFLLHLSENMTISGSNDKQLMHEIYNRETKREHILEARMRELRLKVRAEEVPKISAPEEGSNIDNLEKETEKYFKTIQYEMNRMSGQWTDLNG